MLETISISVSLVALFISFLALYLANFWKGKIQSSLPTQFFLGYSNDGKNKPHVALHSFLYSTGTNGRVIEHLFVVYAQPEQKQTFNVWYAGQSNVRNRVGGLRINRDGINLNNLFYPPSTETGFKFAPGKITIKLYARMAGKKEPQLLNETKLNLSNKRVADIEAGMLAVFDIRSTGTDYHEFADTFQKDDGKEFLDGFQKMVAIIDAQSKEKS